jgi:hypothetical protein
MKMIVFVALLAAAGCSKKTADCEASIGKGMDNLEASVKAAKSNPQMQDNRLTVLTKLRGTLTQRCNEDKWPAEVVSCFATVVSMKDMQGCQAKLSNDQRSKLVTEIRQVMVGSMGAMRMPGGVPGHPPMLAPGSAGGAPGAPGGDTPGSPAGSAAAPGGAGAAPAGAGAAPGGAGAAPTTPGAAPAGAGAAPAVAGAAPATPGATPTTPGAARGAASPAAGSGHP